MFTFQEETDCYSFQQLDYIYFVHSLCLLGRLLLYKDSRELFPVSLPSTDGRQYFISYGIINSFGVTSQPSGSRA